MNRFYASLFVILGLLLAAPSFAAWTANPGGGTTVYSLGGDTHYAYYDFSDTTNSTLIEVSKCKVLTIRFDGDITAATTGAEGWWRSCSSAAVSVNTCERVYTDAGVVTLNGDPTTGRAAIYGERALWGYFEVDTNAGSDDARVWLICDQEGG